MLALMLRVGGRDYGVDVRYVREVLPLVPLHEREGDSLPVLAYHGRDLPVMDLTKVFWGRPAAQILTTRIVVVRVDRGGSGLEVGLIAETVTETRSIRNPVAADDAAVDGAIPARVVRDADGCVYAMIDLPRVLDAASA